MEKSIGSLSDGAAGLRRDWWPVTWLPAVDPPVPHGYDGPSLIGSYVLNRRRPMRTRIRGLMSVLTVLFGLSLGIHAETFERPAKILETALEHIQEESEAIEGRAVLLSHSTKNISNSASEKVTVTLPGAFSGGFLDAITNHVGYARALHYPPLIRQHLPSGEAAPLLKMWDEIQTTRGTLIDEAGGLEVRRDKLVKEGEDLDRKAGELNEEQRELNSEIDDYNNRCAGRPRNQFCEDWRARLVSRKTDLERRIGEHNDKIADWQTQVGEFNDDAAKHSGARESWGKRINEFINTATQSLNSETICQLKRWDRQRLICEYHCRLYINGVPIADQGWWWIEWDGTEGSCAQFEDIDKLQPFPSAPSLRGAS